MHWSNTSELILEVGMKAFRIIAIAAIAVLCAVWPANARAQSFNKKTVFTFSQPVEIPNLVLPAGTYVFKPLDQVTPNLIQILNSDETHVYATLLTVSDYRNDTPEETVITFEERQGRSPKAIKEWFYPGDNVGEEFLYSDRQ
jgi:hypothetical protein